MRSLAVVLALVAACSSKPAPAPPPGADPAAAPVPARRALEPDARPTEVDAGRIDKKDVLEGQAAIEAMNSATPVPESSGEWIVDSRGLGPFTVGGVFSDRVARGAGCVPPGRVALASKVLRWRCGAAFTLEVSDGRLRRITILVREPRTITDEGIGVGSSVEDAIAAHGEARPAPGGGWVLDTLPGIRVITEVDKPGATPDKPGSRIVRLEILGPEALAEED
jgi:hypothetical protein